MKQSLEKGLREGRSTPIAVARRVTRVGTSCHLAMCAFVGCGGSVAPARDAAPAADAADVTVVPLSPTDELDLLLVIGNENAMWQNQQNLRPQFGALLDALTHPPCTSAANPAPHACVASDPNDQPVAPAVRSLHLAVIDPDLGTAGSTAPGCENSDAGDDGLLNPIRFGPADQHHNPATLEMPPGARPLDCIDPNEFPSFITFTSGATDPTQFAHDAVCNAVLLVNGCSYAQPLEAVWRALLWHDARDRVGNTDPNAGFVRDGAVLAIVTLVDREDFSVVDCRYVLPGDPACPNPRALDVFDSASTAWGSADVRLRTYLYAPCGPQDPTWPLARYIDPTQAGAGLLALKPGRPDRVVFAAITGVPLAGDGYPTLADGSTNWDGLLGTPSSLGPDDFCGRDATASGAAVDTVSREGRISMRQADADPLCSERVVPACRREGTMDDPSMPACVTSTQYFAEPARRIVEVARRFDQAPLCNGTPCHNGLVASICGNDDTTAIAAIAAHIQARLR